MLEVFRNILHKEKNPQKKEINLLKKEIKTKYPEIFKSAERGINNIEFYTYKTKDKYLIYPNIKAYVQKAGFKELLITSNEGVGIESLPLFNLIIIEERYLPKLTEIHDFAPEFLDTALKNVFGDIKKGIEGHEGEHSNNFALKAHSENFETKAKLYNAQLRRTNETKNLSEKLEKSTKKTEFYAESQRILRKNKQHSEIIDQISYDQIFWILLDKGIKRGLETEINKEEYFKKLNESPDKNSREIKGTYPYLKSHIINKSIDNMEQIRQELRKKYEDKYGKIRQ